MTHAQFTRERDFCAMVSIASALLGRGDISEADFTALRRQFLEEYRPVISGVRDVQ